VRDETRESGGCDGKSGAAGPDATAGLRAAAPHTHPAGCACRCRRRWAGLARCAVLPRVMILVEARRSDTQNAGFHSADARTYFTRVSPLSSRSVCRKCHIRHNHTNADTTGQTHHVPARRQRPCVLAVGTTTRAACGHAERTTTRRGGAHTEHMHEQHRCSVCAARPYRPPYAVHRPSRSRLRCGRPYSECRAAAAASGSLPPRLTHGQQLGPGARRAPFRPLSHPPKSPN
jgi:hypothetical protein